MRHSNPGAVRAGRAYGEAALAAHPFILREAAYFAVLACAREERSITQGVRQRCPLPNWWGLRRARRQREGRRE